MKIEDKIRGKKKLRYDINKKSSKPALSSSKTDTDEYLQRRRHCLLIKVES